MRCFRAALALSAALLAAAPAAAQRAVPAVYRGFTDLAEHRVLRVAVAPGVALEVLDWGGSGPPLVFLSGLSNTGHVFDTFAPRFTGSFRVVTLTRRGLGTSDRPDPGPYDAATLAADVKAVLDTLGIARANLVGYSFGGTEAAYFAATYPERTERIIFLESYCGGCDTLAPRRRRPPLRPAGPPLHDRDTLTAAGMMAYQRRTLGFSYPEAELRLINVYENGTVRLAVPAFVWQALGRGVPHPGLAKVRAPALAIFAERSTVEHEFWWAGRMNPAVRALAQVYVDVATEHRRASQDYFVRALPNARAAVIRGAHHAVFLSHPDATEHLIREFLLFPTDAPPADPARSADH